MVSKKPDISRRAIPEGNATQAQIEDTVLISLRLVRRRLMPFHIFRLDPSLDRKHLRLNQDLLS